MTFFNVNCKYKEVCKDRCSDYCSKCKHFKLPEKSFFEVKE